MARFIQGGNLPLFYHIGSAFSAGATVLGSDHPTSPTLIQYRNPDGTGFELYGSFSIDEFGHLSGTINQIFLTAQDTSLSGVIDWLAISAENFEGALFGVAGPTVIAPFQLFWSDDVIDATAHGSGSARLEGYGGNDVLFGTGAFDDILEGGFGSDVLWGYGGNDALVGGADNDTLDGGTGEFDVAIFAGSWDNYRISQASSDALVVGQDGVDTIRNIERLRFLNDNQDVDTNAWLAKSWIDANQHEIATTTITLYENFFDQLARYLSSTGDFSGPTKLIKNFSSYLKLSGYGFAAIEFEQRISVTSNVPKTVFVEICNLIISELVTKGAAAALGAIGGPFAPFLTIAVTPGVAIIYDKYLEDQCKAALGNIYDSVSGLIDPTVPLPPTALIDVTQAVAFDASFYRAAHPEVDVAVLSGSMPSALAHFLSIGADSGYAPNAAQSLPADQLAYRLTDVHAFSNRAAFDVTLGQLAGDGHSLEEQQFAGLINGLRTTTPPLAVDANLSAMAHRKVLDLVSNWPDNPATRILGSADSAWTSLWSTNQALREAFRDTTDALIGANSPDSALKLLVGTSLSTSPSDVLAQLRQQTGGELALTGTMFDTVGLAEYAGIWVIILADRQAGYSPGIPSSDTLSEVFAYGTANADILLSGHRSGTLTGYDGADQLIGGRASDVLRGDDGNDTLNGGLGTDSLLGGDDGDRMIATTSDGNDTMTGGNGFDVLDMSAVGGVVQVNQFAGTVTGSAGNDTLTDIFEQVIGTAFGDVLAGGNGINVLDGNGGADHLYGNGGQDLLRGGDGNDTFYGQTSDGNDTIEGGAGFDLITFASAGGVIQLNMFTNATTGTAGNDSFTGIEYVIGSNFGDIIAGNNGVNAFEGGGGADQLFGNGGVDWMRGGTGNDTVILGTGNDTYYFRNGDGVDTINDFVAGGTDDNIDLTTAATGYASFAAMQGFAGAIVQSGADTLLNLDPGGGSTDRIILKNVTATNLTAADFAF